MGLVLARSSLEPAIKLSVISCLVGLLNFGDSGAHTGHGMC